MEKRLVNYLYLKTILFSVIRLNKCDNYCGGIIGLIIIGLTFKIYLDYKKDIKWKYIRINGVMDDT